MRGTRACTRVHDTPNTPNGIGVVGRGLVIVREAARDDFLAA